MGGVLKRLIFSCLQNPTVYEFEQDRRFCQRPLCKQFEFVTQFVIQSVTSLSEDGNKTKIPWPSLL